MSVFLFWEQERVQRDFQTEVQTLIQQKRRTELGTLEVLFIPHGQFRYMHVTDYHMKLTLKKSFVY